jgi:hypothetical protein
VLPADLPVSWDLADKIPDGVDVTTLLASAKPFDNTLAQYARTARELAELKLPPREYLVEHWLATDSLSMIFATRGIGKTWVGLALAWPLRRRRTFWPTGFLGRAWSYSGMAR